MDHAEASKNEKKEPVRLVGNLHRGALREMKLDQLISKQQQKQPFIMRR